MNNTFLSRADSFILNIGKIRVSYIGYMTLLYEDLPSSDVQKNFSLSDQMLKEVEILSSKEEQVHLKVEMSTIDLSMDKVKTLATSMAKEENANWGGATAAAARWVRGRVGRCVLSKLDGRRHQLAKPRHAR